MADDYEMLYEFWRDVVRRHDGRGWTVVASYDGDFWLRDAYAWGLVREALHGRDDVEYRYVNPALVAEAAPESQRDLLFIGRPKLFTQSVFQPFAARLAVLAQGTFLDYPNGTPGDTLRYDAHTFRRHDLEAWPEHYRRSDIDYAVFQLVNEEVAGERRTLVSLAGLSAFGTACLAFLFAKPKLRARLAQQIAEMAALLKPKRNVPSTADPQPTAALQPRAYLEVCVRISVEGDAGLRRFLNDPAVDFQVEAVAVRGADRPAFREDTARIVLRPRAKGGVVSIANTDKSLDVGGSRFGLLRWLVEHPEETRTEDLFAPLGITPTDDRDAKRAASMRVAKTVHDLNVVLGGLDVFRERNAIESRKQRYVLNAMATVVKE